MGEYFTALILDILRGWIGTSEGGDLRKMTRDQIEIYQAMEDRHTRELQDLLRGMFHGPVSPL